MKRVFLVFAILVSLICFGKERAIDSIAAVVSDEVITNSDIDNLLKESKTINKADLTKENALNFLIENSILVQQAKLMNIRIPTKDLDYTIESFAKEHNQSVESLAQVLKEQGTTIADFRINFERKMLILRAVASLMSNADKPTSKEIDSYWASHKDDQIMLSFNDRVFDHPPKGTSWKNKKPNVVSNMFVKSLPKEYQVVILANLFNKEYGPIKTENGFHMVEVTGWQGALMPKQYAANLLMMQAIDKTRSKIVRQLRKNYYIKVYS